MCLDAGYPEQQCSRKSANGCTSSRLRSSGTPVIDVLVLFRQNGYVDLEAICVKKSYDVTQWLRFSWRIVISCGSSLSS